MTNLAQIFIGRVQLGNQHLHESGVGAKLRLVVAIPEGEVGESHSSVPANSDALRGQILNFAILTEVVGDNELGKCVQGAEFAHRVPVFLVEGEFHEEGDVLGGVWHFVQVEDRSLRWVLQSLAVLEQLLDQLVDHGLATALLIFGAM